MNKAIKEIAKIDKSLLDKIEYILGGELNSEEYNIFYNYFNEIRKPNILIDIKDDENIKDYITNLLQENERLNNIIKHLVYHIYYHEEVDELFEQVFKLALGKQFCKVLPIEEQIDIEELKEKSDNNER